MFIDKIGEVRNKPLIGMLHLAGENPVNQAMEELRIYQEEGLDGVIVEDYHGSEGDVVNTLEAISEKPPKILVGLNLLANPYKSFSLAHRCGADFVQIDSVESYHLSLSAYEEERRVYPDVAVMGGVRFKYKGGSRNPLEWDIRCAKDRCEVIVTTGEGTGIATPIEKLRGFKRFTDDYPLFVGAGVTARNVYEQLNVADGAIVGSYFKRGNTRWKVDAKTVGHLVRVVEGLRN